MRAVSAIVLAGVGSAGMAAPDGSVRPKTRDGGITLAALATAPNASLRPVLRPAPAETRVSTTHDAGLRQWVAAFRSRALAEGISARVYDNAMASVRYVADVVRRDRNQSEFTKTIWDYLDTAVSDHRIRNGKAALKKHRALLDRVEKRFGVDREIVVAIWGLESAYGAVRGKTDVMSAMATLAYDARRAAFFEAQVLAALKILQDGHTTPARLKGSWAGAMGHTQFMPTSWRDHAVDFNGDGRRDIWGDDPTDALASTAAYLKANGWRTGQPWGVEVRVPDGFDYASARRENTRMPSAWARLGVVAMDGRAVPDHGRASVLLPAGHQGAAFLVFDNFEVLESYNTADAYVIGVGHLADRITGGGPIRGDWPRQDRALTYDERIELQTRLTAAGFDTRKIDARIGPLTIAAVRAYQQSKGWVPDGYASLNVLKSLR
ncbi:lytic murein transglycosylase [Pseudaestuariivita atlantica]